MNLKTLVVITGPSPDDFVGQYGIIVATKTLWGEGNKQQTFCKVKVGNKLSDWLSPDALALLMN